MLLASLGWYFESQINGCNVFKPEATKMICDAFRAARVLDMSAGWGDRLLGCMASASVKRSVATLEIVLAH